jgi:predicted DCC family thiol-disulfide oxidoreductase YuxK
MKSTACFPLTIYYDASCPLCADEMHALKIADADGRLVLVDCSAPEFDDTPFAGYGITRDSMMHLIHARDAGGRWLKGIDVFEAAYDAAGFTVLARLWGHSRLRPWWDKLYPWVARNRYALSRLGLPHLFRLLTKKAARRSALAPTHACGTGVCILDKRSAKQKTGDRFMA